MYPITSIFRTERGLIPGYGLAPSKPGRYTFPTSLLLLSESNLRAVTCVEVSESVPSIIISTRRGWYGVQEDSYQGAPAYSIDNMPLRLLEPERSYISDEQVVDMAFRAAYSLAAIRLNALNAHIRDLVFVEFRAKPVAGREFTGAFQYILDFSRLTTPHIYMWLYHVLVCLFRTKALRINRNERIVRLSLNNVWWRDIVLMLFKHLAVDFSVEYGHRRAYVKFTRQEFRRMLTRMLQTKFPRLVEDFAFVDAVTTKDRIILDTDGITTLDVTHDIPDTPTRSKLHGKFTEYVGPHISFPEIDDFLETNGLIL